MTVEPEMSRELSCERRQGCFTGPEQRQDEALIVRRGVAEIRDE